MIGARNVCGSSTVVGRLLAKQKGAGSTPVSRCKMKPIFYILSAILLVNCSRGTTPQLSPEAKQLAAPVALEEGKAAFIGQVVFQGTPPSPTPLQVASFPECSMAHPKGILSEDVLVKDDKVENVFVYVKEGLSGPFPVPQEPIVLDQKGCIYKPHVFGIQVGQTLTILNSDPMIHNIHSVIAEETLFNVAMPVQGQKLTQTFSKPQVTVTLKCDIHGWMRAYAGVLPHPFYGVTDEKGNFEIRNIPPGQYTIAAWHERFGEQLVKYVTLKPSEIKFVQITFSSIP